MHGMGLCIVNALSECCDVDAWWDGRHFQIGFARGVAVSPLRELGDTNRRGMRLAFTPDFSILERAGWDREAITTRLRELAALHPHVTFILDHDAVRCPDGLVDHARYLAGTRVTPAHHAIARDGIAVDAALAWRERGAPIVASFVNTRALRIAGIDDGLWRAFADVEPAQFAGVHRAAFRELIEVGLVAVVAVEYADARWDYRASTLTSPEVGP